MFIELVDALRCPNGHEESWMVASSDRMEARHIVTGSVGCPVCSAVFPIRDGVVDFRRVPAPPAAHRTQGSADEAMRLAVLLDLTDSQGFAVLLGEWGNHAHELRGIVETPLVLVDPPDGITGAPGISVIRCDGDIPLAERAARAIAVDTADSARVISAGRVARAGGRVIAPADAPIPSDVTELARDGRDWLGERQAAVSAVVPLHVRRGSPSSTEPTGGALG